MLVEGAVIEKKPFGGIVPQIEGCPLPNRLEDLGSSWVTPAGCGPPAENAFYRNFKATERFFASIGPMLMLWVCQTVLYVTFGGKAKVWGFPLASTLNCAWSVGLQCNVSRGYRFSHLWDDSVTVVIIVIDVNVTDAFILELRRQMALWWPWSLYNRCSKDADGKIDENELPSHQIVCPLTDAADDSRHNWHLSQYEQNVSIRSVFAWYDPP